ncbi:hypothetical protein [Umboniibacter marinipuniceus]|uniref:Uncharacterized protein n=1 Tax=Umboniibacter marinipuniceus TaxID=569599 RepID=A0A3M0ADU8_9GAMM|nr:hypothetical protein [Umboniibacter marinipuniceus]RMA82677.1 hypothetical protein DFR27_0630 [Umboniibacter marinipuniceus]
MLNDNQLALIPIDICVPVQVFRADYTIVQNNQLPFVREFILRLLELSNMTKDQIGKFMGFTEKETEVALGQMINLDEIQVNDKGKFQLTPKAQGYFSSQQENRPKTQCLEDIRKEFRFDLLTFSYVKSNEKVGSATSAIRIYPSTEAISTSGKSAKSAFQRYFHQIHEEEDFRYLTIDNPDLYKISSFKKQSEKFQRFNQVYGLDTDRNRVEPIQSPDFLSKEEVVAFLSKHLRDNRPANNHREIATVFDSFDYEFGVSSLKRGYLDVAEYGIEARRSVLSGDKYKPLVGSLILNDNWSIFEKQLDAAINASPKKSVNVTWIAPSDGYWAKSEYQLQHFKNLSAKKKVNLEVFLPVPHRKDRKVRKGYINQFRPLKESLRGFVEGYLKGCGEVVIINDRAAFVMCYLYQNNDFLPIPFGFLTEDPHVISELISSFKSYLSQLDGEFESRDLGSLHKLK